MPAGPDQKPDLPSLLEQAGLQSLRDEFWATRAKAIQAYARLEQALCRVFALISGTSPKVAALIFFKLGSQPRVAILDKLIKDHYKAEYNLFWNSILKAMRPIDDNRAQIVHWAVVTHTPILVHGLGETMICLRPPTFWADLDDSAPAIDCADMLSFTEKCDFYTQHIDAFATLHEGLWTTYGNEERPWRDIFRKPLAYPPQSDTQSSQTP